MARKPKVRVHYEEPISSLSRWSCRGDGVWQTGHSAKTAYQNWKNVTSCVRMFLNGEKPPRGLVEVYKYEIKSELSKYGFY